MRYRGSIYIYKVMLSDESMLIMNMRTQSKLKVLKENVAEVERIINPNTVIDLNENDYITLKKGGFIIPETLDEVKLIEMKNNEFIFGDNTLNVTIIPTNDCNFKCIYCYETPDPYRMSFDTETRIIKFLEREIPHCKQLRLSWFGGEPLLCGDQVIRISQAANNICKKYKKPMLGAISTNGYCLEVPIFRELIKNRILDFQICVDGPERFHNNTRPHKTTDDSYKKIIQNLIDIKNQVHSSSYKIGIRCNVTPAVENHMNEHIEELSKFFGNDRRFYLTYQCVRNWGGERISKQQIVYDEQVIYEKLYKLSREKNMYSADGLSFAPFIGCDAKSKKGYLIDPRGRVHKCSLAMFNKDTEDINNIGELDNEGRALIDESKLAQWLVGSSKYNDKCPKCFMFPYCITAICPYNKVFLNRDNCNLYTESMLKEHLLALDKLNSIKIWEGYKNE